jgi:hypothetical protein
MREGKGPATGEIYIYIYIYMAPSMVIGYHLSLSPIGGCIIICN